MRKLVIILFLQFILFFTFSCNKSKDKETSIDSQSSASQKTVNWLPEEDSTYKIIGYKKGLKGFVVKYSNDLYRGGNILSIEGGKLLRKLNIKTIISITPDETIKTIAKTLGIKTVDLFYDYGDLTDSLTLEFLSLIEKESTPFYIHCYSGKQRAGLLCAIYRVHKDSWTFEKAEAEYDKLGGKVKEDHELFIKAYEIIKTF